MTLILASASPRRRELLARVTEDFEVAVSHADERAEGTPEERAIQAASAKAHAVAGNHSGVIIGADTIVVLDGEILEKPRDRADARRMLETLSGRDHEVITGLCLLSTWSGEAVTAFESTIVRFRHLSEDEIEQYLDTEEHADKAGAYGIQGHAGAFVSTIFGDYHNVMGLPLCRLVLLLRRMGVRV